jgi:hypothetical protein
VRYAQTIVQKLGSRRLAALAVALVVAGGTGTSAGADSRRHDSNDTIVFTVDVAEDFSQFVPTLVKPTDTEPKRGSFFVTEGRIFPGGTIKGDGADFDPNSSGAIGRWFCRGTHLVSGSEFPTAPLGVSTAQLYLLPNQNKSISTEGVEGAAPARRPVTGGTGIYRDYIGEQKQELLGFNATGGVNLRVTFILKKAVR